MAIHADIRNYVICPACGESTPQDNPFCEDCGAERGAQLTNWDVLCEVGRRAADQIDEGRWIVGDTALLVEKHYGEDRLSDYARECNLPKKRVQQYRTVCQFYPQSTRVDFLRDRPNLTYTHLRDAMRMGDTEKAYAALENAALENWTTDEFGVFLLQRLGKPVPPRKLYDGEVDAQLIALPLHLTLDLAATAKVRLVIYEVQS